MPQADSRSITPKILLPKRLPAAVRAKVEDALERLMTAQDALLAYLDRMDGDTDLEASIDHPFNKPSAMVDLEGGDVQDEPHDPEADEPSLAHTNDLNQEQARRHLTAVQYRDGTWFGMDEDREAEHDGREPDNDREERCDDDLEQSRPAAE